MRTHQDCVRIAAYHLWQSTGSPNGRDLEFWFVAEQTILQEKVRREPTKNGDISMPWREPPAGK